MGIGTIIAGALGVGGSLLSSRNNSRATEQATNAQLQGNQASLDLMERLYNQNRDDLSPFRDFELQRTNALGEIFGFDAVGDNDNGAGTGGGQFRTLSLSPHSTTHLDVVQRFLDIQVEVEEKDRDETIVSIQPVTTD